MTILFQGTVAFLAGAHESAVFPVPGGIKQPGVALNVKLSLQGDNLPAGTTTVTVFISTDGGATYRSASMTIDAPRTYRGSPPHWEMLGYEIGADDVPTHAKFSYDVPSAFSTAVKLEAL
jgi:hypothetical protein